MAKKIKLMQEQSTKSQISLEELIDLILEGQNYHPKDSSFRSITSRWSKSSHETFEFPGKYIKAVNTKVTTEDGRDLEMDYAGTVLPDGKLVDIKSSLNVEHQSQLPDYSKIDTIMYYQVGLIKTTDLPPLAVIITNKNPGKSVIDYEIHNRVLRIHYIIVTSEKISKRLNILRNIVNTRREFNEAEVLNFAYIAIFVETDAKIIMEEVATIFANFPRIDLTLRLDLYQVLKKMILYHFQDDLEKTREMIYMITKNLTDDEFRKLNSYEKTIYEKDQEINDKDQQLIQKDKEINNLEKKVKELEEQVNGKK